MTFIRSTFSIAAFNPWFFAHPPVSVIASFAPAFRHYKTAFCNRLLNSCRNFILRFSFSDQCDNLRLCKYSTLCRDQDRHFRCKTRLRNSSETSSERTFAMDSSALYRRPHLSFIANVFTIPSVSTAIPFYICPPISMILRTDKRICHVLLPIAWQLISEIFSSACGTFVSPVSVPIRYVRSEISFFRPASAIAWYRPCLGALHWSAQSYLLHDVFVFIQDHRFRIGRTYITSPKYFIFFPPLPSQFITIIQIGRISGSSLNTVDIPIFVDCIGIAFLDTVLDPSDHAVPDPWIRSLAWSSNNNPWDT